MKKSEWLDNSLIVGPRFCLCLSAKQFKRMAKEAGVGGDMPQFVSTGCSATVHPGVTKDGESVMFVCMKKMDKTTEALGILTHEAVHIWQNHLEQIGEQSASPELEAYAIGHISKQLFDAYLG